MVVWVKKVDTEVKFCYADCNKRGIKVVSIDRKGTVTVLAVVVLLLNLIEFRRTVDFTAPGIRMPKENAFGKQRIREGGKRGWLDRNPGCPDYRCDL